MIDPAGDQIGEEEWPGNWGCASSARWPVTIDGTHSIVFFSDDDTGVFEFTVGLLRNELVTLDASENIHQVAHSFVIPRDSIEYELPLEAGQLVSIEVNTINGECSRSTLFDLRIELLDPAGERVGDDAWPGNFGCSGFGPWEAEVGGVHRVRFFEDSGSVGAFEATIGRLGG